MRRRFTETVPGTKIFSMATPLFVPMIEEGFIFDDVSNAIIRTYLSDPGLEGIQALDPGMYSLSDNQEPD